MQFGVFDHLDFSGEPFAEQFESRLKMAEAYDRCGLYGYHLAEHHGTTLGAAPSPNVFLSALAQRTKRIRLGPLVYVLPLYNPLRLIEEIAMLDHLSNGRLMIGVGKGASPIEARFCGVPDEEIGPRFEEARECLMRGLTRDRLDFQGRFYRFDDVPLRMRPLQQPRPPLWYGLNRHETLGWAVANDVNVVMLALDPQARVLADAYRAEWKRAGKPEGALPLIGVSRHVVVADTDAEASALARSAYARWIASFERLWTESGINIRQLIPGLSKTYPESWDDLVAIGNGVAGSPETVLRFARKTIDATGCNYLASWLAFGNLSAPQVIRSAELFSKHVMSAFV
ncbi:MAG: LLM class flavin-dependent oxidoreductase [Hyphomonadaceae bacterium]|nr:LLM class flavin-dependent oxidoreductase [Hyphomonadaceae bacterium]